MNFTIIIYLVLGLGLAVLSISLKRASRIKSVSRPEVKALIAGFRSKSDPSNEDYDNLFLYLLEGFEAHRSKEGSRSYYPGLPSKHGREVDGLEGFSRSAPLWGAWVHSGRANVLRLVDGRMVRLDDEFRHGLLAGTNPRSPEYWGDMIDYNQRIVEAADIALALWLFRDAVWARLSQKDQAMVAAWLLQVNGKKVKNGNWHLFPVFVNVVLEQLGAPHDLEHAKQHYGRIKEFYRGTGWFSEGPGNRFDYYNAWAFQYLLYWIDTINPNWDHPFISQAEKEFISNFRYFIGPAGFPILGRSVCYRMAVPAPLIFGQQRYPNLVSPSEARRALDKIWAYFIQHRALAGGNVTQGYCGQDPRILDNYSGPASCLWASRSLIAAFSQPAASPFWISPPGQLPVEKESYEINLSNLGWKIVGDKATGRIQLFQLSISSSAAVSLEDYGLFRRVADLFSSKTHRPANKKAKYGAAVYDSASPFCGCL